MKRILDVMCSTGRLVIGVPPAPPM